MWLDVNLDIFEQIRFVDKVLYGYKNDQKS